MHSQPLCCQTPSLLLWGAFWQREGTDEFEFGNHYNVVKLFLKKSRNDEEKGLPKGVCH